MFGKSLRVHPDWIGTVKSAYQSRYACQKDLAEDAEIYSVDTVNKFLNGRSISRKNFWRLCGLLELSWETVIDSTFVSQDTDLLNAEAKQDPSPRQEEEEIKPKSTSTTLENPNFIGREQEIGYLRHLNNQGYTCILLLASGGVGKTTLARCFLKREFSTYIEFSMAKEQKNIASAPSLVEEKLRQLNEEPGKEFYISLERLKHKLQTQKIGILVDNLESALDGQGRFLDKHRDYVDLLRVLCDPSLQSLTIITSREPLYESLDVHLFLLRSLSLEDWRSYFSHHQLVTDISLLGEIHKAYNGNALAMKVLSEPIKQYYSSDVSAYWRDYNLDREILVEKAVENLIKEQFDRLREVNLEAYNLLCRLGCYRYQDISTVPLESLFHLLWDVLNNKNKVINTLVRCSLIERKDNEYYLHPIIRSEAIKRLQQDTESYEKSNQRAAEFWEMSVSDIQTLTDGLKKLEAYYHYISIEQYNSAAKLLTYRSQEDYNSIAESSLLGKLRGFGSYQKLFSILDFLSRKSEINSFYKRHIFGFKADVQAILGLSQNSIIDYKKAIDISRGDNDLIHLCDCMAALALLYMNLGEYQKSIDIFEEVITISKKFEENNSGLNILELIVRASLSCLSFVYFLHGNSKMSLKYLALSAEKFNQDYEIYGSSWWSIYDRYNYALSSIAHHRFDKVKKVCDDLNMLYRKHSYPLAKAIVLELTGKILLEQGYFQEAIKEFCKAEEIFKHLEINNNLAEVYIQMGLIYKRTDEVEKTWEYQDRAIQLFTDIQAPKQVERVKQIFSK